MILCCLTLLVISLNCKFSLHFYYIRPLSDAEKAVISHYGPDAIAAVLMSRPVEPKIPKAAISDDEPVARRLVRHRDILMV